jgi:hypothetical protein
MAIELALEVEGRFGVTVPLDELDEGASLAALIALAGRLLDGTPAPATTLEVAETPAPIPGLASCETTTATLEAYGDYARPIIRRRLGVVKLDKRYL